MIEVSEKLETPYMHSHPKALGLMQAEYPVEDERTSRSVSQNKLDIRVAIGITEDIVKARQAGRILALNMGFSSSQATLIVTVISELARNIVLYALSGEIFMTVFAKDQHVGLLITALDKGPGIEDIDCVLASGYSSSGGLGLGLAGVRLIMDEFEIKSEKGIGTKVVAGIWLK